MKRNRFMKRLSILVLTVLAVMLSVGLSVTAMASESSQIKSELVDPSKSGSISVTIKATDGTVPGGILNLYKVADVKADDTGYHFYYTADFSSASTNITDNSVDLSTEAVAEELAAIVSSKGLNPSQSKVIGSDGVVSFSVPVGAYLLIQDEVDEKYSAVDPFVVTVPVSQEITNSDGSKEIVLTYDIDATPKAGTATVNPTATPTESPTPTESSSKTKIVHKTVTTVTATTVKTGDTSNFVLWGILVIAACVVITIIVRRGRRGADN